jgi:uncharacterized repeat protein (TIGR01451 family)
MIKHKGGEKIQKQTITIKTFIPLLLLSLSIFFCVSAVSASNEIYVNTTGNDTSGTGTAYDPYLTIQTGVNNLDPNGIIHIANGQYSGVNNTNITINKNMTITGENQTGTIINGTGTNWIFNITSGTNVTLCNLTLTNGFTSDYGGAILNRGNLNAKDCTFTDNTASNTNWGSYGWGGAICNREGSSTITGCTFKNNSANTGGALSNSLMSSGTITSTVTDCTFIGNSALMWGGAIENWKSASGLSSDLTANYNRFYKNLAPEGSAIYNYAGTVNATLNWWGSNTDPATINNLIVGTVESNPWLVLGINANPTSIYNGQTSTVTANLLHDSGILTDPNHPENYYHDPQYGHVPDGIPVTFSLIDGPLGTLGSQTPFVNGAASIIFTATTVGIQHVNATIDDENVTAAINIDPSGHVQISKIAADSTPNYWSLVTFTIRAHNDGPNDVEGLQVTDLLPTGLTLVSADTHGFGTYFAGLWDIGTLTNGTTAILTLLVNATSTGTFTNWANVTAQTTNDLQAWSKDSASVTVAAASYLSINKEFRDLPWGNVITTAYYNDKIYAIVKVHNQGPDSTSVSVRDSLNGLSWTGNYYVLHAVGSYIPTPSSWILNDPTCPFNGTHWNINNLPTFIGSVKWLAIEGIISQTDTVSNYAETVEQSSYPYQGYDHYTSYLTATSTPTNITVDNVRGNKGESVNLTAVLTDYLANPLNGQTLEFWIDNVKVGENTTDNTGTATFNYKISQTPGSHTLKAVFNGDTEYQGSEATGELYVPQADLYIQITSNKNNPTVGEMFTLTYKLGNNGPDDATNVTITIPIPEGFVISSISGDGNWTQNGNTITWTFNNVTVGDPYLYITGWTTEPGIYIFSASIASDTFSINSRGVSSLSINSVPQVNAATTNNSVGMQKTGAPIAGIVLAILMVLGGLVATRKKQ